MAYKIEKFGDHRERRSFSKTTNKFELKDLLSIQKESYNWFLTEGIKEVSLVIYLLVLVIIHLMNLDTV